MAGWIRKAEVCARVALAGALCAAGSGAHAALVDVTFGGYVYDVQQTNTALLSGVVPSGTSTRFTGGFTYDTSVADTAPGATFGQYDGAVSGFFVDFGNGLLFTQDASLPQKYVSTANDRTDYVTPFDGFYAYSQLGIAGYAGPEGYAEAGIAMQSDILSALVSDALPTSLSFAPFLGACAASPLSAGDVGGVKAALHCAEMEFHAVNTRSEQAMHVFGVIDEGGSVVRAPEPAGGGLIALGLLSLLRLRARRARTDRPPVDALAADSRVCMDAVEWQREWLRDVRRANLARAASRI